MLYVAKQYITVFDYDKSKLVRYKKGDNLDNLSQSDIKSIIIKNLADIKVSDDDIPEISNPKEYLSVEEINKMNKKADLLDYANFLKVEGITSTDNKDVIKQKIIDYLEALKTADVVNEVIPDENI